MDYLLFPKLFPYFFSCVSHFLDAFYYQTTCLLKPYSPLRFISNTSSPMMAFIFSIYSDFNYGQKKYFIYIIKKHLFSIQYLEETVTETKITCVY